MAEYIEKNHFDERIRVAIGMSEGDLTSDFKDGVLFVLELLKTEDSCAEYEKIKLERDISIQQIHDLGNSVSKAIEEIEREINSDFWNYYFCHGMKYAREILKRNIGE